MNSMGTAALGNVSQYLVAQDRWLLWRVEQRINRATGEISKTKPPVSYHTSKRCDATDPRSWTSFAKAAAALGMSAAWDGVGFALGLIDALDEIAIGIDFDACLDADDALADWALPFLVAMDTYTEYSPGGAGLKCVARLRLTDLPTARSLLDIPETDKDQARTRIFGPKAPGGHAAGVQLFLGKRYFTITGRLWHATPEDVTLLSLRQLERLGSLFGPNEQRGRATQRDAATDNDATEPDEAALRDRLGAEFLRNPRLRERWEGGVEGLNDISRSGRDMSVLALLVSAGFSNGETRGALRLFEHGKLKDEPPRYFEQMWARTKATPRRELEPPAEWEAEHPPADTLDQRTTRTTEPTLPPQFSENALALLFTARHADALIHVHQWGQWMHWAAGRWQEDHAVTVFDKARAICAEQGGIATMVLKRSGAKVASGINKASTVAAIERLARHHHRHVRHSDNFDANPVMLNTSTTAIGLRGNP